MSAIHEVPIGDFNGNAAKAIASIVSTSSLTNVNSTSSTTNNTKVTISSNSDTSVPKAEESQDTKPTSNGDAKTTADTNVQSGRGSPLASTSKGTETKSPSAVNNNNNANANTKNSLSDFGDDLKIIGHIKNIEKINEKRRLFLNNTISEYTIDEKTETETTTQTVNGAKTIISETRNHTREEQEHVDGNKIGGVGATDINGFTTTTSAAHPVAKYATLPRTPGSPPPKPPMLSRTRSIGVGDQKSYSVTSLPPTPTAVASATSSPVASATLLAPIASPTPSGTLTPTSPLSDPAVTISSTSGVTTPKTSLTPTLITSSVLPQPIKVATVQLREDTVPSLRRLIERPVSLSPEAPKQISVNHYERLIEELKCPGCAYPMKTPILLCKTGHSICQQCTRVLLLCPLCKEPFTNIRSLTVEALCSKAHFRCTNASGGCTVRLQIELLGWHEKQCIYKPMKCFMGRVWSDCDWNGREAHWKDHLEKLHADKVFHTHTTDMTWNMGIKQKPLTGYYVFIVYDEMFNFYEVYDKERILFTMACTSTVKEKKHNYAFEVTIVHQDNEAIAITQKYPVHSEYDNDILAEGTCISMPLTDLAKFIDEDRLLHYRIRIVEIKTPRKSRNSQRSSPNASVHPTDFQQTQIEGVNLKSVPAGVIVTRKLDDIPYADNSSAVTPRNGGAQSIEGVSETEAMGVTVLLPYQIPEGKTGAQAIDYLTKRLLALGAVHTGQFLVDCETYISTPPHGPAKTVHVLHDSEYPASTFSILDNGAGKQIPLVADNLFDLLMLKMTTVYTSKKQTKIESKGARFEYGDFLIKLGSVTMMENFKGILIEIEYRPCVVLSYCWEMIREMLQGFLGMQIAKEYPAYFTQQIINTMGQQQIHQKQNDLFEAIDTINQYLESFTNYRKQNMLPVASGSGGGAVSAQNTAAGMQGGNQRMRV